MKDWYLKSVEEVSRELQVEKDKGLNNKVVEQRRRADGLNEIPKADNRPLFMVFFDRFKDVLVLMLLAGAIASIIFGRYGDAVIIGVAILLDASLSFAQVIRTEKTIEKLREQIQPTATVIRNGITKVIPAKYLVRGDLFELSMGEKVPADGRIIASRGMKVDESSLTGESRPVEKSISRMNKRTQVSNRKNMVYMGTVINEGSGMAIVTATGAGTEIGKIAQMLKVSKSPPSPLHRQLQRSGLTIGMVIVGAIFVLSAVGIWSGMSVVETVVTAITLIVSAIPEDLTMILTIALTIGVARILRHKGAVKELRSGETLGSATVICTDKTGTLTYGKMSANHIDTMGAGMIKEDNEDEDDIRRLGVIALALANDAHKVKGEDGVEFMGSATEVTSLKFVEKYGLDQNDLRKMWAQRDLISFSRQWMYYATLNDHPTRSDRCLFVKGAPEVLLGKSTYKLKKGGEVGEISSEERRDMQKRITTLAKEGKRLMGVAVKRNVKETEIDHGSVDDLVFMGVLVISDPVRQDVKKVITKTERAGIAVKIVTGDHMETARAIAREVGIVAGEDNAITSEDIERMSDVELEEIVDDITVFARVTPLDKQRIIKALRVNGHVVAMTGDGVNDAVALKSADIGVAMGSGKDIAKEAADLILLDDSFKIIVMAVQEGRVLRDNLKKVIAFLLSTNAAEVTIFFVSLVFGWPLPLLPAQILWINLVTDGTSDIALALEPKERNVMKRKPNDPQAHLLGGTMGFHIIVTGIIVTAVTMGLYRYVLNADDSNLVYARTMAFTFLAFSSLLSVWSFRSLNDSILKRGFRGNKWVFVSLAASATLHLMALYIPQFQSFFETVPLGVRDWALILVISLITVAAIDLRKPVMRWGVKKLKSKRRSGQFMVETKEEPG